MRLALAPSSLARPTDSAPLAGVYRVARDDLAFRDLLFEFVSPPPTFAGTKTAHVLGSSSTASGSSAGPPSSSADLMQMGFPALVHTTYPAVCACHGKLKTSGYSCPRCKARLCDVPTECRVCALTVVNAPQLARSYRHLFPVRPPLSHVRALDQEERELTCIFLAQVANYERILQCVLPLAQSPPSSSSLIRRPAHRSSAPSTDSPTCFSCFFPFASPPTTSTAAAAGDLSPLGRYRCPKCTNDFCLECDKLVHDALGFCPGCAGA